VIKNSLKIFLLAILAIIILFSTAHAEKQGIFQNVLIIFEGSDNDNSIARNVGLQLADLLGHFDVNYSLTAADLYKPGEIENYSVIFYLGVLKNYTIPEYLLEDIYRTRKTFCWINNHIEEIRKASSEEKWGFQILGLSGNESFKADSPFAFISPDDRFLAFCDILHDILGEDHPRSKMAIIRIEDVNATSDVDQIKTVSDYLNSEKIPFLISLVPIYKNPDNDISIPISSRPSFVKAIKHAEEMGGALFCME